MPPTVSVAICCHNAAERLPNTLSYLARQKTPPGLKWEVLIIDNGSNDGTREVALNSWPSTVSAPLRVIEELKLGVHHARHTALQQSISEIICFVDDDNWVCDDWVQVVSEIMEAHRDVGALGARTEAAFQSPPPPWIGNLIRNLAVGDQAAKEGDITQSIGRLWGAGMSLRRSAWEELSRSGFSFLSTGRSGKELGSGEDSELCYALRMSGWRLYYTNRIFLKHYMPSSRLRWEYLIRIYRGFGANQTVLDIYQNALSPRDPQLRRLFAVKLIALCWRTAKCATKVLRKSDRSREGNEDFLRLQYCLGYLSRLWSSRSQYRHLQESIQALSKRLKIARIKRAPSAPSN